VTYIIDKEIKFVVNQSVIIYKEEVHKLPIMCSRLFEYLLKNRNKKVSRDDILTEVWEAIGLTPSNNSLNNYISMIRKELSNTSFGGHLETIPKYGFILKVDDVEFINTTENEQEDGHCIPIEKNTQYSLRNMLVKVSLLSLFFLLAGSLGLVTFLSLGEGGFIYLNKNGLCDVYIAEGVEGNHLDKMLNSKIGMRVTKKCITENGVVYFDDVKTSDKLETYSSILSFCGKTKRGSVNECQNYIHINDN